MLFSTCHQEIGGFCCAGGGRGDLVRFRALCAKPVSSMLGQELALPFAAEVGM